MLQKKIVISESPCKLGSAELACCVDCRQGTAPVIVTVFCLCINGETTFNSVDGKINSSDHQVVRASASGAVDSS